MSELPEPRPVYGAPSEPITLIPVTGIPEVAPGGDLAEIIVDAIHSSGNEIEADDVLVVTQKIVSKAEGRIVEVHPHDKEARRMVAEGESVRIVRRRDEIMICETRHGFICANAGVDASNLEPGQVTLLPVDSDKSARRLRRRIRQITGKAPAVIISDTFGRAWRIGHTNVAIGVAGMLPVIDYRDTPDHFGTPLRVTMIAIADELAGAAELVMGKADGVPVAIARGVRHKKGRGNATSLVRPPDEDLFR
jgi:coenzyme F420-0:L-glutamate ligase/coenzyme F420-1:gamma-L-glutamate ligase